MLKVIVNSTPIIALYEIDKLDLLRQMYGKIIIPKAVYMEVSEKDDGLKETIDKFSDWINVVNLSSDADKVMYKAKLHDGEVEVMMLAKELNADLVIIDDYPARQTAKYLNLKLTGTVGVMLKAKQNGYIEEVMPIIYRMIEKGIYFSDKLIMQIKKISNE